MADKPGRERNPDAPPSLRFPLVRSYHAGKAHALLPDTSDGPALCGLMASQKHLWLPRWLHAGETSRLFRIDCDRCRERATYMLAALSDADVAE